MTPRAGLLLVVVGALVLTGALTTYGEQPSGVGWRFAVRDARWVDAEPYALQADLYVSQVGHQAARDVRLWIRYPHELFELTDMFPGADGWLPFLGGQPIGRWQPGDTYVLEFGFRYDHRRQQRVVELLRQTELRIEWTEGTERRSQVISLPEVPPPSGTA